MDENTVYIDCDGVIIDSEQRMLERKFQMGFKNHKDEKEFDTYFEYTNSHPEEWDYIIRGAKSINNSVEIIRELEKLKKKIVILTKIHTLIEMKTKVNDLRTNRKICAPIIFVPPGIKKYEMVQPNNQLLIDDSKKNIKGWIEHGGKGLVFDEKLEMDDVSKVKNLNFLLMR